ncbi:MULTISPECIES: PHB depolymerase family esterase [Rhodomicrobium]|uniref:extracellular catalytic domain type 1 short-chain-length polyhydroxyalkanoate depolymerase n=1 Tax=Rhodomicrobium TaxID=1068 RepID=UPI000B4BCDC0|nr:MULTISPECIES: PHB depolymerase family esterase [Rhodomicrobium]
MGISAPRGSAIDQDSLSGRQRQRTKALSRAGAFLRRLIGRHHGAIQEGADTEKRTLAPDAPVTPQGGRFITEVFANFAGMRNYRLFIPSAYRGQALPLIVMLHGCKQWPDDFAAGTRMNYLAEEFGCFVAYPAQPKSANGSRCWNWFSPRHQHRGRGEPSIIAGITREVMRQYGIDQSRVYVAGLSAGGALTAVLAATYPDLYAAVGVHSGLARGSARNVPSALSAMRNGHASVAEAPLLGTGPDGARRFVPAIVFHGDRDDTVHPRNADHVIAQVLPDGGSALRQAKKQGRVKGGHAYSLTRYINPRGQTVLEYWAVHNSGHAWSGGDSTGSYTDSAGPDASREMLRFFLSHRLEAARVMEDAAISG